MQSGMIGTALRYCNGKQTMTARHESVLASIASIIRSELGDNTIPITNATTAHDVAAWDSLAHIGIILQVEKTFGIRLKAAEVASLDKVGTLVDLVMARSSAA